MINSSLVFKSLHCLLLVWIPVFSIPFSYFPVRYQEVAFVVSFLTTNKQIKTPAREYWQGNLKVLQIPGRCIELNRPERSRGSSRNGPWCEHRGFWQTFLTCQRSALSDQFSMASCLRTHCFILIVLSSRVENCKCALITFSSFDSFRAAL